MYKKGFYLYFLSQVKLSSVSDSSADLDCLMDVAGVTLKSRSNPRGAPLSARSIAAQVDAAVREQETTLHRRQVGYSKCHCTRTKKYFTSETGWLFKMSLYENKILLYI